MAYGTQHDLGDCYFFWFNRRDSPVVTMAPFYHRPTRLSQQYVEVHEKPTNLTPLTHHNKRTNRRTCPKLQHCSQLEARQATYETQLAPAVQHTWQHTCKLGLEAAGCVGPVAA